MDGKYPLLTGYNSINNHGGRPRKRNTRCAFALDDDMDPAIHDVSASRGVVRFAS